jgi:hypothetical protein
MNPAILNSQFVQVALPIVLTIFIAAWINGKGLEGVNGSISGIHKRLDDIVGRLDRIEKKLDDHAERIARLEERTSPIGRRT